MKNIFLAYVQTKFAKHKPREKTQIYVSGSGEQPQIKFFVAECVGQKATIMYYLAASLQPEIKFSWCFTILWPWGTFARGRLDGDLSEIDFKNYLGEYVKCELAINEVDYEKYKRLKKEEKERNFYRINFK